MKQYTIRLDDITPDMNWDNFERMLRLLKKYEIRPLLGVVPDNQDELLHCMEARADFFDVIRGLQKEGFCIAQHGYTHLYETDAKGLLGLNPFSEFAGLPPERQREKLEKGKAVLTKEGIDTNIFMPPGHTYDKNTLKALRELGFCYITDGFFKKPYRMEGMTFFPCTMLESYKGKGVNTLCIHLNHKADRDFEELESFIKKNREFIRDFDCEALAKEAVKKTPAVAFSEKAALRLRAVKQRAAQSEAVSAYLSATDSSSRTGKLLKRVVCIPLLFWKLIKGGKAGKAV